jgi:hypothetical protein
LLSSDCHSIRLSIYGKKLGARYWAPLVLSEELS